MALALLCNLLAYSEMIEVLTGGFMVRAAVIFFVLAIVAYLFGANGIAGISMEIGKTLLGIFLAIAVVTIVAAMVTGRFLIGPKR